MRIVAIIVTYNRLGLLKKCVAAIGRQTRKPDELIIINNSATDGTGEWLHQQDLNHVTIENKGGAWGFYEGIKRAYSSDADWIWMMDDDSIPGVDALEKLEEAVRFFDHCGVNVGFFASNVLWTDNQPHMMNKTYCYDHGGQIPGCFDSPGAKGYKPIAGATFVSLLLSGKAVEKSGLPLKEFFIWCDDIEYTKRIVNAGMWGVFVEDSVVVHETPTNYSNNIFEDSPSNLWKYNYGLRNELYTRKVYKSKSSFYRNVLKRMVVWPVRIMLKRKNNRWPFIKMIWKTSIAALNFHPTIERVSSNNPLDHRR